MKEDAVKGWTADDLFGPDPSDEELEELIAEDASSVDYVFVTREDEERYAALQRARKSPLLGEKCLLDPLTERRFRNLPNYSGPAYYEIIRKI